MLKSGVDFNTFNKINLKLLNSDLIIKDTITEYNDNVDKVDQSYFKSKITITDKDKINKNVLVEVSKISVNHKNPPENIKNYSCYQEMNSVSNSLYKTLIEKGKRKVFYLNSFLDLTSKAVRSRENEMGNWISKLKLKVVLIWFYSKEDQSGQ